MGGLLVTAGTLLVGCCLLKPELQVLQQEVEQATPCCDDVIGELVFECLSADVHERAREHVEMTVFNVPELHSQAQ